jgi:GT2 family glycosyltransferase
VVVTGGKTVVVVPNWNGLDFLAECLNSLIVQSACNFSITVVDNGSTDGSRELVQNQYPSVKLIMRDKNYGFTGGTNPGIQDAIAGGAEYVALFNNDAVADKNWLQFLVETADQDHHLGSVTSKILQVGAERKIDSTGDFYSIWGLPFPRGRDEIDQGQFDSDDQRLVFAGTGGATLFRTRMLCEIGLFDQDFFAYYEDIDLGFRAQLSGWKAAYEPRALVCHRVHATSSRIPNFTRYHAHKNAIYVYHKNMPTKLWWKYLPWFLTGMAVMAANSLRRQQFIPLVKAYSVVLLKIPATIRKRWWIQRRSKVSAADIDAILYHALPPGYHRIVYKLFDRKKLAHKPRSGSESPTQGSG